MITGGFGFIGKNLITKLLDMQVKEIIVISNSNDKNFSKKVNFYKERCDIYSSLEYIFNKHKIDIVFNLATKDINYSFINPKESALSSINIILNLLELQRKKAFKTLYNFSSSEAYGNYYKTIDENNKFNPNTTYGAGKASADILVNTYIKMFNIDAFSIILSNAFGPFETQSALIPITISRILNKKEPIIYGNGSNRINLIYIKDVLDSILKLYEKEKFKGSINICSDTSLSVKEIIQYISKVMKYKGSILYKKADSKANNYNSYSNEKIKKLINFKQTKLKEGLLETINWYKNEQ